MLNKTQLDLASRVLSLALSKASSQVCSQVFEAGDRPKTLLLTKLCMITLHHIGRIGKNVPQQSAVFSVPQVGEWSDSLKSGVIVGTGKEYPPAGTWMQVHPIVKLCEPPQTTLFSASQLLSAIVDGRDVRDVFTLANRDFIVWNKTNKEAVWLNTTWKVSENIIGRVPPGLLSLLHMSLEEDSDAMVSFTKRGVAVIAHVYIPNKHVVVSWMCSQQGLPETLQYRLNGKYYQIEVEKQNFKNQKEISEMEFGTLTLDGLKRPEDRESSAPIKENPVSTPAVETNKKAIEAAAKPTADSVVDTVVADVPVKDLEPPVEDQETAQDTTTPIPAPVVELSNEEKIEQVATALTDMSFIFRSVCKTLKAVAKDIRKASKKPADTEEVEKLKAQVAKLQRMLQAAMQ